MMTSFMEVNLLPNERVRDKYSFGIRVLSYSILIVLCLSFGIIGWVRHSSATKYCLDLTNTKRSEASVQTQIQSIQSSLNGQLPIQKFLEGNPQFQVKQLVNDITSILPAGSSLTDVQLAKNELTITGNIQSLTSLANYQDNLSKINQVTTVSLGNVTTPTGQTGFNFSLTVGFKGVGGN
jgi:hypothetical protein